MKKSTFKNYLNPITRRPAEHHTERFQVTFTISAEKHFSDPAQLAEMIEIIMMSNNPIGKWSQVTIEHVDEVNKL